MKTLYLFIAFFICICFTGYAQTENPDTKNLTKEEKKALRKAKKEEDKRKRAEALINFEKYAELKEWVVEAHLVFDKQGQSYQMNPSINFVSVIQDQTTIQLSFNAGLVKLMQALQQANRPFELMTYPGETHFIRNRASQLHLDLTELSFFDRHLKPTSEADR